MITFLIILHVFVCIALIMIVLLQSGKGADMGAAFGGSSQTVFGGAGPAPFLGKITTGAAIIFMITSLSLAYFSANPLGGSVVEDVKTITQPFPEAPVAGGVQPAAEEKTVAPVFPDSIPETK